MRGHVNNFDVGPEHPFDGWSNQMGHVNNFDFGPEHLFDGWSNQMVHINCVVAIKRVVLN